MPRPIVTRVKFIEVKEKEDLLTSLTHYGEKISISVFQRIYWYGSHHLKITVSRGNYYYTLESIIPECKKDIEEIKDLMFDELTHQMDELNIRLETDILQNGSA